MQITNCIVVIQVYQTNMHAVKVHAYFENLLIVDELKCQQYTIVGN